MLTAIFSNEVETGDKGGIYYIKLNFFNLRGAKGLR